MTLQWILHLYVGEALIKITVFCDKCNNVGFNKKLSKVDGIDWHMACFQFTAPPKNGPHMSHDGGGGVQSQCSATIVKQNKVF